MSFPVPCPPCYLVEWYRPEVTEDLDDTVTKLDECVASISTANSPVQLLMADGDRTAAGSTNGSDGADG